MPAFDQDRLIVVLVRARNPANIGASARALHDLGFRHLRIVNEFPVPFQAALAASRAAVDASAVLESAQAFPTVAAAIADCTFVVGTTAVGERVVQHPLHLLPEAVPILHRAALTGKVALLFGSEKTGLSNDELSHCHALVTIPMNPAADGHLSMNLGQAVAVCLYALAHQPAEPTVPQSSQSDEWAAPEPPATGAATERLTTLLRGVLERSGYTRRHPANSRETNLRRLVLRMALTHADAAVWTGVLRQLTHALPEIFAPGSSSDDGTPPRL